MDDEALIACARNGDAASLALLLQRHYLAVKKYLITITFSPDMAEDLTQETMIRAIQRLIQYTGKAKFSTWLISIATNLYMDRLRRARRERKILEPPAPAPPDHGYDPEWADLMQRLRSLPRDIALPIVLKHYYGYSYEEIAGLMSIPVGTVKSRIHNGIRMLRKEVEADA